MIKIIIYISIFLFFFFNTGVFANENKSVLIPAGSFKMGSDIEEDQKPIHLVFVSAFYIDQYETTQKEFENVMGYNPSQFKNPSLPVENVDWFEANEYCVKIGKRLPTEAEWEKAARGKTQTRYYWENEMSSDFAWYVKNSDRKTHPVGNKQPNFFGLYDISGNVWEWVSDWFEPDYFKFSPFSNPIGPKTGKFKTGTMDILRKTNS